MLVDIAEFNGTVLWETDKPNGQRSRPTDLSKLNNMFPNIKYTDIREGLRQAWNWFVDNYEVARKQYNE